MGKKEHIQNIASFGSLLLHRKGQCHLMYALQAFQTGQAAQDALLNNQGNRSNRVVIATETLLGPECKNMSAEVLPRLQLQQSWKPGRFMQDPKMDFALVTHLGMERCTLFHHQQTAKRAVLQSLASVQ